MSVQQIFDAILGQAGVIVVLLVILWSGWRGMWVFGRYHQEMQQELRGQITKLEARLDRAITAAEDRSGIANRAIRQSEDRHTGVSGG